VVGQRRREIVIKAVVLERQKYVAEVTNVTEVTAV